MAEEQGNQVNVPNNQMPQQTIQQPHKGILDQTFGEILQSNPQAQQLIMRTMGLDQQKFQEMLGAAEGNPIMNQKIGDLFKSGFFRQAQSMQQVSPEQFQQMMQQTNGQPGGATMQPVVVIPMQVNGQTAYPGQGVPQGNVATQQGQKLSLLERVKGWFK